MAYRHHPGVYDPKFKKNSQRRELEDLMSEWYGSRFAALEITKRTENATPVSESMDKILEKYLNKNSMQSLTLQENWDQIAGQVLNKFTSLATVKDNKVVVEVKHPAFMLELKRQGNDKALLQKIRSSCPELEISEIVFVPAGQYHPADE